MELVGKGPRGGQRVSVVHGKQAGARSALSTNPLPYAIHDIDLNSVLTALIISPEGGGLPFHLQW